MSLMPKDWIKSIRMQKIVSIELRLTISNMLVSPRLPLEVFDAISLHHLKRRIMQIMRLKTQMFVNLVKMIQRIIYVVVLHIICLCMLLHLIQLQQPHNKPLEFYVARSRVSLHCLLFMQLILDMVVNKMQKRLNSSSFINQLGPLQIQGLMLPLSQRKLPNSPQMSII